MWLEFNSDLKCYVSWLWSSFIPHFGGTKETFIPIPDAGMDVLVGGLKLQAIPAHYLHSSGNFHLYDPKAKILFSGDVGAALLPSGGDGLFVEDFNHHIRFAEAFHRRWMGSDKAKRDWCARVSQLDIEMMCPQHGAIYRGEDIRRFIDWFANLEVGVVR
jgi:flavorubredoxin